MSTEVTGHSFTVKVNGDLRTIRADSIEEYQLRRAEAIDNLSGDLELSQLAQAVTNAAPLVTNPAPSAVQAAPVQQAPAPTVAAIPVADSAGQHMCDHQMPMRFVPPGISKTTNKPYAGFWACSMPRGQQCAKKVST